MIPTTSIGKTRSQDSHSSFSSNVLFTVLFWCWWSITSSSTWVGQLDYCSTSQYTQVTFKTKSKTLSIINKLNNIKLVKRYIEMINNAKEWLKWNETQSDHRRCHVEVWRPIAGVFNPTWNPIPQNTTKASTSTQTKRINCNKQELCSMWCWSSMVNNT